MDFPFKLNDYFLYEISVIQSNLLPSNFNGSAEKTKSCIAVVSEILNTMGKASATAQKLQTPVTSAIKLSHADHMLYLMINLSSNKGNGTVTGYLKMGWKDLFIFDTFGLYVKRRCFCCLDFYIHESKQRQGFGKRLFDFMLEDNGINANVIPVDRPSDKLLKFLQKHYNLRRIVPQANNFIIYEQFFNDLNDNTKDQNKNTSNFCRSVQPFSYRRVY